MKLLEIDKDMDLLRKVKLHRRDAITNQQAEMMLHAIGADNRKYRMYLGRKIYHAYRNYYDAGGTDIELWDDLVSKGYAEKGIFYRVTAMGLDILEIMTGSTIYDDYDCVPDCRHDMLIEYMKHDVACCYGSWIPMSAKTVGEYLHMPLHLARATAKVLAEEGLLVRDHYGDIDEDGYPHCYHGYSLTDKAREYEVYEELKKAEYKYIEEEILSHGRDDQSK